MIDDKEPQGSPEKENVARIPSVEQLTRTAHVFNFNQKNYVPLDEFQQLQQLASILEERVNQAAEIIYSQQDEDDKRTQDLAFHAAVEIAKGYSHLTPREVVRNFEQLYSGVLDILDGVEEVEDEFPSEDGPVDPGDALAALTKDQS